MEDVLKQNLIKKLGIDSLPEEEQEEVLLRIGKIVFELVLIRIMERLNPEEQDELERLLTEKPNDEEAILGFLRSKISDFDEIVNEEVSNFKTEILDLVKEREG